MQSMKGFTPARRRALAILPVASLAAIGVATLIAHMRVHAMRDQVVRTHAVLEAADRVLRDLTDAETGQRGYLLTGRASYLAPYGRAMVALGQDTVELRRLIGGNASQLARLRLLGPHIQEKLAELRETVGLRRQGGAAAALALVASDRGRAAMDVSRGLLTGLRREETQLLEARLASEAERDRLFLVVFIGGLLLVVYSILRANGALAGYAAAQERALSWISTQNQQLSAQRDALEESAARMETLNGELLERTRAEESAHAETEAERRRLEHLHELTVALSGTTTAADVAHAAGKWGRAVMGAATALVAVPTEDGSALQAVDVSGLPPEFVARWPRIPRDAAAVIAEAARSHRVVRAESAAVRDELYPALGLRGGLEAALGAPLELDGRELGAWVIYFDAPRHFSPAELRLFQAVTELCGQAMERARLFEAEHRARAEAERANTAKLAFLRVLSHDVRTPLNAIIGYGDLLEGGFAGGLQEQQRDFVRRILTSTAVLRRMMEEMLDYARVEAGRLEIRPADLEVGPLLDGVETVVAPHAQERGIALRRGALPSVLLHGDADRVHQILSNLITNAVKYTPSGGTVTVDGLADDAGVALRVTDDGPGIEAGDLERIFEPFVQLEGSGGRAHGQGVGLGLAISRELARAMGGELRVESEPGRTCFTLRLPCGKCDVVAGG